MITIDFFFNVDLCSLTKSKNEEQTKQGQRVLVNLKVPFSIRLKFGSVPP
jgi:hypothetical protein